jgi:hypothetical protein
MTKIGDVLDEFFSPFSSETLWVMPETDEYTQRVLKWGPVKQAVDRIKTHLASQCDVWKAGFVTDGSWKPSKTDSPKPGAHREFVPSPPGTDPETCKSAFIVYVTSKAAKSVNPLGGLLPSAQTNALYTCSIGSFNIYTTVDAINCSAKTATMNFWMYNNMSKRSFGRFADHPAFSLSGMKNQYMWWNWVESVEWTSGSVKTVPRAKGSGGW